MGCSASSAPSTIRSRKAKPTGLKAQPTSEENGSNKFDPRLPLTVRQKFNITKSWKGIARNIEQTGTLMFLRLFETNEEVRSMFMKITKGQHSISELRDSKSLENHVKQVMYTLDEAFSSLEDVDTVIKMLQSLGRSHRKLQPLGFNPTVFWKIEEPFLIAVKETLGDRYTANIEHIYRKTIKFILQTLVDGFDNNT